MKRPIESCLVLGLVAGCTLDASSGGEQLCTDEGCDDGDDADAADGESLQAPPPVRRDCGQDCAPLADAVSAFTARSTSQIGCTNWGSRYFDYQAGKYRRPQDLYGPDYLSLLSACRDGDGELYEMRAGTAPSTSGEIPNTAVRFLSTAESMTEPMRMTFSGEFDVGWCDLYVRPVIDGEVQLESFTIGANQSRKTAVYSWQYPMSGGIHTLSFQWSLRPDCPIGEGASIRNATVMTEGASRFGIGDAFAVGTRSSFSLSAPQGGTSGWKTISLAPSPLGVTLTEAGPLAIEFSAGVTTYDETKLEIEVTLDGQVVGNFVLSEHDWDENSPFVPGTKVVRPRTVTFIKDGVAAGGHTMGLRARLGNFGDDGMKSASLSRIKLSAVSRAPVASMVDMDVAAIPGPLALDQTDWTAIPGAALTLTPPRTGEAAITATLEVNGDVPLPSIYAHGAVLDIAPRINGQVREEQAVRTHLPASFTKETSQWTFALKDLPGDAPTGFELVYRRGTGELGAVTLEEGTLVIEERPMFGPDLGLGPRVGPGSMPKLGRSARRDSRLEPGPRAPTTPVIGVVFDARRLACDGPHTGAAPADYDATDWTACQNNMTPPHPTFGVADLMDLLDGAAPKVHDFYAAVSGGRTDVQIEAVYYVATKDDPQPDSQNEYTFQGCTCGLAGPNETAYVSAKSRMVVESIEGARAQGQLDFSQYDRNGDGALSGDELTFLIITPQHDLMGSSGATAPATFPLCGVDGMGDPSCDEPAELYVVDGVTIESVSFLYLDISAPRTLDDRAAIMHELMHPTELLDDTYSLFPANTAQTSLDLMSETLGAAGTLPPALTRVSGFTALAKGWVTPVYPEVESGTYMLEDVATSGQVMILPRFDAPHREYFLLEVRQDHLPTTEPDTYDFGINDNGLAVWHVIEPGPECVCDPDEDPDSTCNVGACQAMQPEFCPIDGWANYSDHSYSRYGVRLLQPDLVFVGGLSRGTLANPERRLWQFATETLSDASGVCPGDPTLPTNQVGVPQLQWSDGSPTGYALTNFAYDPMGGTVTFDLTTPDF